MKWLSMIKIILESCMFACNNIISAQSLEILDVWIYPLHHCIDTQRSKTYFITHSQKAVFHTDGSQKYFFKMM